MKKTRKKLLAMALASAMVTTVLPTTAFAGEVTTPTAPANGGVVGVDVSVIAPLIRVNVPTSLEVSIDQFELGGTGSQIYSESFSMENISETAVHINVKSEATVGTNTKFAESRSGAKEENEMWLAAVAAKDATHYQAVDEADDLSLLNEESVNVSTFSNTDKLTTQEFYLQDKSGVGYALFIADKAGTPDNIENYVEYHKLTPIAIENDATENEIVAELNKKLVTNDVYYYAAEDIDAAALADATNASSVKIEKFSKGKVVVTTDLVDGDTYFTIAKEDVPKVTTTFTTSDKYIAIKEATGTQGETANNVAKFRYIGTLSEATSVWESAMLPKINIIYQITPISPTKYAEVNWACKYGYYQTLAPTVTAIGSDGVTVNNGEITLNKGSNLKIEYKLGTKTLAATDITSVSFMQDTKAVALSKGTDYTVENGVITLIAEGSKLKSVIGSGVKNSVAADANYYVSVVFNNTAKTAAETGNIVVTVN